VLSEFDADLDRQLQKWFSASRNAEPLNHEDAERVWKDFREANND
jgi:hypothetical protein